MVQVQVQFQLQKKDNGKNNALAFLDIIQDKSN